MRRYGSRLACADLTGEEQIALDEIMRRGNFSSVANAVRCGLGHLARQLDVFDCFDQRERRPAAYSLTKSKRAPRQRANVDPYLSIDEVLS